MEIKKSKKIAVKNKELAKIEDEAAREVLYEKVVKCCRVCYPVDANSLGHLCMNESIVQVRV